MFGLGLIVGIFIGIVGWILASIWWDLRWQRQYGPPAVKMSDLLSDIELTSEDGDVS